MLTQLASVEAHGVDGLPGPQHRVEPPGSHTDHRPALQVLRKDLHTANQRLKQ